MGRVCKTILLLHGQELHEQRDKAISHDNFFSVTMEGCSQRLADEKLECKLDFIVQHVL